MSDAKTITAMYGKTTFEIREAARAAFVAVVAPTRAA